MFQIVDCVYERLSSLREECVGALYGIMSHNTLVVTGLGLSSGTSYAEMLLHLPAGVDFCGAFRSGGPPGIEPVQGILKEVQITDNPIYLERDSVGETTALVQRDGRLTDTCLKIITERDFWEMFVCVRLGGSVPLRRSLAGDESQRSLAENCVFHFTGTEVYLYEDEDTYKTTVAQLLKKAPLSNDPRLHRGLLNVEVLRPLCSSGEKKLSCFAVLPEKRRKDCSVTSSMDALCIVDRTRSVDQLYGLLTDTLWRHLQLLENTMMSCDSSPVGLNALQVYHFYVSPMFVTLIQARENNDNNTKRSREDLHKHLALARDRPVFRTGNRLRWNHRSDILYNVHSSLSGPGSSDAKVATVSGLYSYHHYMQDGFNDDGWGCAYRSLQTLFSWFKYQGYTEADVPSHKDIQTCLVEIGDKQKKFIGSREWIGSAEVGYCLNTWLGVTTYTLTFPSGTALSSSGPDLLKHFEIHGTPIMIGGGQLAHTILGVAHNEETEEIKFLVLDPHYTGAEDLRTIQTKGWVGWKPLEFWKKNSFYNMCLPARPRTL